MYIIKETTSTRKLHVHQIFSFLFIKQVKCRNMTSLESGYILKGYPEIWTPHLIKTLLLITARERCK